MSPLRCALALLSLVSISASATAGERASAVVELFTSQGCASCPTADALILRLSKRADLVVLTLPVDYWDYLGWKDTLASPAHTARQRAYAMARRDRKVYTPQVIVDGAVHVVGSHEGEIEAALTRLKGKDGLLSIALDVEERDDQIHVRVPKTTPNAPSEGEVWVFAVARARTVPIGRGENTGKTVTYANVVRKMTRLGGWKGESTELMVPKAEAVPADADAYVVLLQAGTAGVPGPILGAIRIGD